MYRRILNGWASVKSFVSVARAVVAEYNSHQPVNRPKKQRIHFSEAVVRNSKLRFQLAILVSLLSAAASHGWEAAKGPLMTRWSREVSPENALPDYPRPQMTREKWTNLNGLWQYAIRPAADTTPTKWDGEILVPFPIESALSGVKKSVQPNERLWYRRTFPRERTGRAKAAAAPLWRRGLGVQSLGERQRGR